MLATQSSLHLHLTPDSTLSDLPTHRYRVAATTLTQSVESEFLERPELPGVIVTDAEAIIGVISRQKFFEQMSQEYSREIYLKRHIQVLLNVVEYPALRLPSNYGINDAVIQAFNRSLEYLYEPIVVVFGPNELEMLELNLLILAQSQIFAQMNGIIREQEEATRRYAENLQQEQNRVQEYAAKLESQQSELERRNQILEQQRSQLTQQTEEILSLNQRFQQIGQLLSQEGTKTFQRMLNTVEAIYRSTNNIRGIGKALTSRLIAVDTAMRSMERVSKQSQFLSTQVSILTRHAQGSTPTNQPGLSVIVTEIDSLGNRILEASTQVEAIANEFKFQIEQLTAAAEESQQVATALVEESRATKGAISQLEELLSENTPDEAQT
ncbi:MAG: chemotaxis protein [Chloroflexaceae bacterium]|nr:chemotaxis protein [Chloroflexaceae bacterium]